MSVNVNHNGVWKPATEIHVNQNGTWKRCQEVYVNQNGTWKTTLYTPGSASWTAVGSYNFTVPAGVYNLNVSWPQQGGIVNQNYSVTPYQTIPVSIGTYGVASTFGTISTPGYNYAVGWFSGRVDDRLWSHYSVQTGGYAESHEGFHGNLPGSWGYYNLVNVGTLINTYQFVIAAPVGRAVKNMIQHAAASNGWVTIIELYDPWSNESANSYQFWVQQIVPINISW